MLTVDDERRTGVQGRASLIVPLLDGKLQPGAICVLLAMRQRAAVAVAMRKLPPVHRCLWRTHQASLP